MTDSPPIASPAEPGKTLAALSNRYAVFRRQNQFFGLGVEFVTEVLSGQTLARVPRCQTNILGVVSLRGEILPVVTIDVLLDLPPQPDNATLPILVVRWRDLLVGLRVDAVQSVISLNANEIQPHPMGRDTHFAGIWKTEGEHAITLTVLAGVPLLEALHQQTAPASLSTFKP